MDFTLDYTEIYASDWSKAQSREIALLGILIRDVCVLIWGILTWGHSTVNQETLSDY